MSKRVFRSSPDERESRLRVWVPGQHSRAIRQSEEGGRRTWEKPGEKKRKKRKPWPVMENKISKKKQFVFMKCPP
jgi:hypothetical protein